MGISRVLGLCAALLFASSVTAANTIDLGPSDYRNWGTGSNSHAGVGLRSSTGQTVRLPPLNGNLSVTRNAVVPYGSIANGLRSFTRINPASVAASAAVTGLFLAVDWAWDEAAQSWGKYDLACPPGEVCVTDGSHPVQDMCSTHPFALTEIGQTKVVSASHPFTMGGVSYAPGTVVSVSVGHNAPGQYLNTCLYKYPDASRWEGNPPLRGVIISSPSELEETFIDLSPSDWTVLEDSLPQSDPNSVGRAGHDVMARQGSPLPGFSDQTITGPSSVAGPETTSTSTDPVTGDTIVTTTNTTTNISYGDTTITTTNTTTSTTYQNGQQTSTTVTTETPGELPVDGGGAPPAGDWPGFCDWATVVCDWFNWTQEEPPPDVDLPQVIDDDFFTEKTISFGAKSCPPDHEINLAPFLETTVGVSFQPLCDFAGLIYYMVMAASYIIAAYISIGVARNG